MVDIYGKKIKLGQKATAKVYDQIYEVEIYEVEKEEVYFRIINPGVNDPLRGSFNRLEASRYLNCKKENYALQ